MTGPALVIGVTLLLVFLGALVVDHVEARRDWREWRDDHPTPDQSDPWLP